MKAELMVRKRFRDYEGRRELQKWLPTQRKAVWGVTVKYYVEVCWSC